MKAFAEVLLFLWLRLESQRVMFMFLWAHQSALAGVLLAATGVQNALGRSEGSFITQYNVLKPQPKFDVRPVAKDPREICICQDKDYREAYQKKYPRNT